MVKDNWYLSEEDIKKGIANGISETTIRTRFYYLNWTVKDSITRPVRQRKHFISDETRNLLKENSISYETYYARLKRGWKVEDAATKPLIPPTGKQFKRKKRTSSKFTIEQIAIAEKNGIEYQTLIARKRRGWTVEKAINTPVKTQFRRKDLIKKCR